MRRRPRQPNSAEIAQLAGVSRSTVSRVINGYPNVPDATRRRVQEVIEQHGYCPSASGQGLRGKRPRCVGLFVSDTGFNAQLQATFMYGFAEQVHALGYMTLLGRVNQLDTPAGEHAVRTVLASGSVDAGVFLNTMDAGGLIRDLLREGQVIGALGIQPDAMEEQLYTVNLDDTITGQLVAQVADMGHRTIAFLCDAQSHIDCAGWYRRMAQATADSGLTLICPGCDAGCIGVDEQAEAALAVAARHLVMVCADQTSVFAAYRAAYAHGLTVGSEVSILGMGVMPEQIPLWPRLSGYRFDEREIMQTLASRLIGGLEGVPGVQRHARIGYRWMPGESCAAKLL